MKKIVLLFLFSFSIVFSQETITKNLGDFTTLKVYNGLTVNLHKSESSKIVISGSKSEDVSIKNSNGTLKIRLKFPDAFVADDVQIDLFYNSTINVLDANEGGSIVSDEKLNQQHLEVKAQEGASVNIDIDVKYLDVKSVTGGIIKLSGSTQNQSIEATTGGMYYASNLESKQATITAASGARVEVNATEVLDAKVRFGGSVYYKGSPEVLKHKKVMGGTVKNIN